jgi:hypothetical protein
VTPEHILDFATADVNDLRDQSLLQKVGKAPQVFKVYRGHFVPYLHALSREALEQWMRAMAHRVGVYEVHDLTEMLKAMGSGS